MDNCLNYSELINVYTKKCIPDNVNALYSTSMDVMGYKNGVSVR